MKMKEDVPYEIIAKVLSGNSTLDDDKIVNEWRNQTADNEAIFQEISRYWELSRLESREYPAIDKEELWSTIEKRITHARKRQYSKKSIFLLAAAAACVAVLLTISVSYLFQDHLIEIISDHTHDTEIIVPSGQKMQMVLSDGTRVWLNSGSRLSYSNSFNISRRRVSLEGEAFFEVVTNMEKPFLVKAGGVEIRVTGTSFNVHCYPDEDILSVSLLKGGVSLFSEKDHSMLAALKPNQEARISKTDMSCKILACNVETESIWRQNILKFEGVTAEEVFRKLERWYGVNISCPTKMPDKNYWFTVKTESLTEILQSISKLTPMQFEIKGEEVTVIFK